MESMIEVMGRFCEVTPWAELKVTVTLPVRSSLSIFKPSALLMNPAPEWVCLVMTRLRPTGTMLYTRIPVPPMCVFSVS